MAERATRAGLVAALSLVAAVTACSAGSASVNTDSSEVELPSVLPHVDMASFTLPLDGYKLTPAESKSLTDLRNRAVSACLARFGIRISFPDAPLALTGDGNERRYFLWSADRAAKTGYKYPEITDQVRPKDPEIPAGADDVLTGDGSRDVAGITVPEGGCDGEGNRAVSFENGSRLSSILLGMQSRSYDLMWRNSRVVAAFHSWSLCMSAAGQNYADPKQANDDERFSGRSASAPEKSTATADVRCKAENDVIDTMAAVESAIQVRLIENHGADMTVVRHDLALQRRIIADAK